MRAVQDETSPEYAAAGQILEANRNNPAFLRQYDAAVRRVQGLPPLELAQQRAPQAPTEQVEADEDVGQLPVQAPLFPMTPQAEAALVQQQARADQSRETRELEAQRKEAWAGVPDVKRTKQAQTQLFPEKAKKGPKVAVEGTGRGVATQALTTAAQAGDTRAALEAIETGEGFSPIDKLVANRLKRNSNLPKLAVSPTLDASGQYFPSTDTAVVREVDSHTVLHETVHGFVHRLIAAENAGTVQNAGVRKLRAVMDYVRKANPKLADTYGFKNLSEFASEAMSNPEFQAELQKIPYQRTNAFTAFAKSVLQMLGISPTTENTALAESLIAVDSMLDTGRALQVAEAGTNVEPGMGDEPAVRRQPKQGPTPTPVGVQAMEIVESLGMNPPTDPTAAQRLRKSWDNAVDNPKQVTQNAKSALKRQRNAFETTVWSSDAALQNDIRDALLEQYGNSEETLGTLLSISTAQANGSEAIAGQFLVDGSATYDASVNKWITQESRDNMVAISRSLDVVAEKYGLTKDQAARVGHTVFVARRLEGLTKSNDALYARAARLRTQKRDKEADALEAQAKYIHMTPEQITEGLELLRLMPELQTTIDRWNGSRSNTLDVMVAGGLLSRPDADSWLDAMDYVPFYRDEQLENASGPQEYMRGLQVQGDKKLRGSAQPVHDVLDNMARWMQFAVSRSVKNRTGLALAETAVATGLAEPVVSSDMTKAERRTHHIVRLFKDGEPVEFSMADPLYMDAFQGLQSVSIPTLKFLSSLANVLRQSVVLNPLFSLAQVPQDAVAAMFTSGLSPRFALSIPARAVKEFVKTLANTSQTHNALKKYGVVGQRDVTAAVVRMDAEIMAGLKAPAGFKDRLMRQLHHVAMASDNAVRQAVFEAAEAQGLSRGEALEKAYQLINFRNRGSSKMLAIAAQTIPFFTAYLAATHVMYKTVTGVGTSPQLRAEGLKRLAAMSGSMAALSFLYAMLLGGDDEYENTRTQIRDRLLMIPGTGVGIPLRADVFLLPKVLGENLYQSISDEGFTDGTTLRKSMQELLANSVLSPTVVPQALKPVVEVGINYSFFTGRPLIGTYEQMMEKGRQYNEYTSELGKALGSSGVISPIGVDHLIRGVLGSLGGAILYTTNQLMHNDPDVERPDLSTRDLIGTVPGMASFVTKSTENKLKNDFYELREATRRADLTLKDLEKRSPHLIDKFLEDKKNLARVSLSRDVEQIAKELSQIRKDIVDVSNAPAVLLDAKKKREIITELRGVEKQLLKAAPLSELRKLAEI